MQGLEEYMTKPKSATTTQKVKVAKAPKEKKEKKKKGKKKKKKKKVESSSEEEDDEEEEVEIEVAGGDENAVAVYSGPNYEDVMDTIKGAALDLIGADELATDEPLMDAGLDSLAAVEFGSILMKQFKGVNLPGTLMFDYPNTKLIAEFVHSEMQGLEEY